MKTPEEMAEEYADLCVSDAYYAPLKAGFLAGYQAAKDQLADADKVITYDYVETASNEARELIAKFELKGDEEVLVKALVAAYCRGVDAVDGYLRNSLSAYRASVKQQRWISVKDRLPGVGQEVLVWYHGSHCTAYLQKVKSVKLQPPQFNNVEMFEWCFDDFEDVDVTHWMELPAPPKEEK